MIHRVEVMVCIEWLLEVEVAGLPPIRMWSRTEVNGSEWVLDHMAMQRVRKKKSKA